MLFLPMEFSHLPLYEQIYKAVKKAIFQGDYPPYSKLPSKRVLAKTLGVSVNTVDTAYSQLAAEGYLELRPKSGCFACDIGALVHMGQFTPPQPTQISADFAIDFSPNDVDTQYFPYGLWRRLLRQSFDELDKTLLSSPAEFGLPQLRQGICHYLRQSRGIACSPENIVVGSNTSSILRNIASILSNDLTLATENPVYNRAFRLLSRPDKPALPIAVDKNGIQLHQLVESGANVIYVTPSHQFPLGFSMPIKSRVDLLNWANDRPGRYIIEDDYDSEFRYSGKPLPPIRSMDKGEKVLYISTFSRSIAPSLKISYALLPDHLVAQLGGKSLFSVSGLEQRVVANFMQSGDFERHINKMRNIYRKKRDLLTQNLLYYKQNITISGENAGHHLLVSLKGGNEQEMVETASSHGVKVYPVSAYFIGTPPRAYAATVLLGYGALSPKELTDGVARLAAAWRL